MYQGNAQPTELNFHVANELEYLRFLSLVSLVSQGLQTSGMLWEDRTRRRFALDPIRDSGRDW